MRPSHSSERKRECVTGPPIRVKPVRPADDYRRMRDASVAYPGQASRKLCASHCLTLFIQNNTGRQRRDRESDRLRLGRAPFLRPAGPQLVDLPDFDAIDPDTAPHSGEPLHIALNQFVLRPRFETPDGNQHDTHRLTDALFARPVAAPHFFKIIELPHLRSKNMNDHIAGIDQDPIAIRHALVRALQARLLT